MKKINKTKIMALFLSICCTFLLMPNTKAFANEKVEKSNNYPIIMVHGLFGWGNDELFGVNYWGGKESLKTMLEQKGYTVYTPTIGAVSSNWDRACELYAYLKGGTVDYGEAHSKKYGHNRYGRTFEGVYPEFGTTDESNEIKKVHLVGHSMGGQTVRALVELLETGDAEEMKFTDSSSISPLFTGNKHWVNSITTIATPHDGSQESHKQYDMEPFAHDFFAYMASKGGVIDSDNPCFDFRLDQWGLKKLPNETYKEYFEKVFKSNIWKETKDLSVWDLAPEGAAELNSWADAKDDIYYFSIACEDSHEDLLSKHYVPNINMNPILLKSCRYLGSYTNDTPGEVLVDKSWWPNDGIVSVVSAISPKANSTDLVVDYNGAPEKGIWNYMGKVKNIDHIEVVGQSQLLYKRFLQNKFVDLAKMLTSLPK